MVLVGLEVEGGGVGVGQGLVEEQELNFPSLECDPCATPAGNPHSCPPSQKGSRNILHFYISVITSLGFVRNQEQLDLEMCPAHA